MTRHPYGYEATHARVRRARGRPARCEECGIADPERTYHWAHIHDTNDNDPENYRRLCVPCHGAYDAPKSR